MLKLTKDTCDFCDKKAWHRNFAGDHFCVACMHSWLRVMEAPRELGVTLNALWNKWIAKQV